MRTLLPWLFNNQRGKSTLFVSNNYHIGQKKIIIAVKRIEEVLVDELIADSPQVL